MDFEEFLWAKGYGEEEVERLLPVEVKAKRGTAKSLRTLVNSSRYPDIAEGLKFTAGNIGYEEGIYTFPYFCAFLLKEYLARKDAGGTGRGTQPVR